MSTADKTELIERFWTAAFDERNLEKVAGFGNDDFVYSLQYVRNWVGQSAITDDQGRPLKVYHGTNHEGLDEIIGGWFSDDPDVTKEFGPHRYEAYLRILKPARHDPFIEDSDLVNEYNAMEGTSYTADEIIYDLGLSLADMAVEGGPFQRWLESKGYDGIIAFDETNAVAGVSYVPLDSSQILILKGGLREKADYLSRVRVHPHHFENSAGKQIAASPLDLNDFYDWFADSHVVDAEGRPRVLYRGLTGYQNIDEAPLAGIPRPGYAVFASPSPYVAASYANPEGDTMVGAIAPFYVKGDRLIEFDVKEDRNGRRIFDKFRFDDYARNLGPGTVLVARNVVDAGPRADSTIDPDGLYSYGNDVYAFGPGTEVRSAVGFARPAPDHDLAAGSDQTKTEQFRSWFQESKVTRNGRPLVVYHGSKADIDVFQKGHEDLIFFTVSPRYIDLAVTGATAVYPVYLSVQRIFDPAVLEHVASLPGLSDDDRESLSGSWDWHTIERHSEHIRAAGFDGIRLTENYEDETFENIAVFEPAQIKSAIGNAGTFDPQDSNIVRDIPQEPDDLIDRLKERVLRSTTFARSIREHISSLDPSEIGVSRRGAQAVAATITDSLASGRITPDFANFTAWLLAQAPAVATDLELSIEDTSGVRTAGTYNSAARVAKIFRDRANDSSGVHEILHHTEKMMPEAVQTEIHRAWIKAYMHAWSMGGAKVKAALDDMRKMDREPAAAARVDRAFADGTLSYKTHYHLASASEFWAVNATRILKERFESRTSWKSRAKRWFKELAERAKGVFGIPSEAPILTGLRSVMSGTGQRRSPMMLQSLGGIDRGVGSHSGLAQAPMPTPADIGSGNLRTEAFNSWFGNSAVVNPDGSPLRVFHGTSRSFDQFADLFETDIGGQNFGRKDFWHYFTPDPAVASDYAIHADSRSMYLYSDPNSARANVIPAYVSIQNPMIVVDDGRFGEMEMTPTTFFDLTRSEQRKRYISSDEVYDGILIMNADGTIAAVATEYETAIKSAIGNNGNFDRNDPVITRDLPMSTATVLRGANSSDVATPETAGTLFETPEFKNWFKASKVVSENTGLPQVVYHGSNSNNLEYFELGFSGKTTGNSYAAPAAFFTDSTVNANGYAHSRLIKQLGDFGNPTYGGTVYPVFLSLQNPLIVDAKGKTFKEVMARAIRRAATSGKDGVIVRNVVDAHREGGDDALVPSTTYVAFKAEQVKSALGNPGSFDPSSRHLTDGHTVQLGSKIDLPTLAPAAAAKQGSALAFDKPLYHGTAEAFDTFDMSRAGTGVGHNDQDVGIYMTTDPKMARYFAREARVTHAFMSGEKMPRDGGVIITSKLKPGAKLLDVDSKSEDASQVRTALEYLHTTKGVAKMVRSMGYDGIILDEPRINQIEGWELGQDGRTVVIYNADVVEIVGSHPSPFGAAAKTETQPPAAPAKKPRLPGIHQTDTPEFKTWFGESKIVDASGLPRVVYHGTGSDFNAFDNKHSGRNYHYRNQKGFFFTSRHETADVYAEQASASWRMKDGAPSIMPVFLRIEKPYVRQAQGSPDKWFDWNQTKLYEMAEKAGADGIIVKGGKGFESRLVYVAFDANQIKSAVGNDGTFSVDDNVITRDIPMEQDPPEDQKTADRAARMRLIEIETTPEFAYHGTSVERWAEDRQRTDLYLAKDYLTALNYANEWEFHQAQTPLVIAVPVRQLAKQDASIKLQPNYENVEQYAEGSWGDIADGRAPSEITWSDTYDWSGTFCIGGFEQKHKESCLVVSGPMPVDSLRSARGTEQALPPLLPLTEYGNSPLVVYHGSSEVRTEFAPTTGKRYTFGREYVVPSLASFFTPDIEFAKTFGDAVTPANLAFRNMLDLRHGAMGVEGKAFEFLQNHFGEEVSRFPRGELWEVLDYPYRIAQLRELGYDGVAFLEYDKDGQPHDSFAVFSGDQVTALDLSVVNELTPEETTSSRRRHKGP